MARRMIRLEPPYLISVVLVILLWEASAKAPGFAGGAPDWSVLQMAAHISYVIPLTDYDWLQVIYWTLAYEFVFYIAAGALFWIIGSSRTIRWLACLGALIAVCIMGFLPPLSLLFVFGITVFRHIFLKTHWLISVISVAATVLTMLLLNYPFQAAAGVIAALAILGTARASFLGRIWSPFFLLGALFYSLYLVHVPIGARFVNLFRRFTPDTAFADLCLSLGGLALSLAVAFLFWRWIERPAITLARRAGRALEERHLSNARKVT